MSHLQLHENIRVQARWENEGACRTCHTLLCCGSVSRFLRFGSNLSRLAPFNCKQSILGLSPAAARNYLPGRYVFAAPCTPAEAGVCPTNKQHEHHQYTQRKYTVSPQKRMIPLETCSGPELTEGKHCDAPPAHHAKKQDELRRRRK